MNDAHDHETIAPRRIGTGMVITGWVVAIALVASLLSGVLESRDNPNTGLGGQINADGSAEVQLQQNRMGHYVASGLINGQPVVFLLDTGATDVSVPEALARRLGLRRGAPGLAHTANGTVTTFRTRLQSVALGPIESENVRAHINPGMTGDEVLLGMSFLRSLELIQREGVLTLRRHPSS